ncbi:hypothetical protein FGIG_06553 [Fasciola gigantica]|uniref:Uncharacterized protein n=1 Tax=Fasciola gigantica TaxID=46835 RepID=A0A504YXY4_FASGI|nr:hypothetical protein FGIG_06553 [Fasciola gigantica]
MLMHEEKPVAPPPIFRIVRTEGEVRQSLAKAPNIFRPGVGYELWDERMKFFVRGTHAQETRSYILRYLSDDAAHQFLSSKLSKSAPAGSGYPTRIRSLFVNRRPHWRMPSTQPLDSRRWNRWKVLSASTSLTSPTVCLVRLQVAVSQSLKPSARTVLSLAVGLNTVATICQYAQLNGEVSQHLLRLYL